MEEKILAKLDRIEVKVEQMEAKMEIKFDELKKELKKEILDHMFVFEAEYGRKINILFEEIMCQNAKDRNIEGDLVTLERRVDKNSAFIMSHENQLATLNRAKL